MSEKKHSGENVASVTVQMRRRRKGQNYLQRRVPIQKKETLRIREGTNVPTPEPQLEVPTASPPTESRDSASIVRTTMGSIGPMIPLIATLKDLIRKSMQWRQFRKNWMK